MSYIAYFTILGFINFCICKAQTSKEVTDCEITVGERLNYESKKCHLYYIYLIEIFQMYYIMQSTDFVWLLVVAYILLKIQFVDRRLYIEILKISYELLCDLLCI